MPGVVPGTYAAHFGLPADSNSTPASPHDGKNQVRAEHDTKDDELGLFEIHKPPSSHPGGGANENTFRAKAIK
jgi:hypothetical protein